MVSFVLKLYVRDELFSTKINVPSLAEFTFERFTETVRDLAPGFRISRLTWRDGEGELVTLQNDRHLSDALQYLHRLDGTEYLRIHGTVFSVIQQEQSNNADINPVLPLVCSSQQLEPSDARTAPTDACILLDVKAEPCDDSPSNEPSSESLQFPDGAGYLTRSPNSSTPGSSTRNGEKNAGSIEQQLSSPGSFGQVPNAVVKSEPFISETSNALISRVPTMSSSSSDINAGAAETGRSAVDAFIASSQLSQRAAKRKSTPSSNASPQQQALIEPNGPSALQRQANMRNGILQIESVPSDQEEQASLARNKKPQEKCRVTKPNALLRELETTLNVLVAPQNVLEQPGFPVWLTSTEPRKSRYFPQIGDDVVYFWQGHLLYVREVIEQQLCRIDQSSLPYEKYRDYIKTEEICRVIDVKFMLKPRRLCSLKLAQLNAQNGQETGTEFTFKYHDLSGVVDFIVLKQFYDQALERYWMPNYLFRTVIDDEVFSGRIVALNPFQKALPNSNFLSVQAKLSIPAKQTRLSLWDLEVFEKQEFPVSDLAKFALADDKDWPPHGKTAESQRLLAGLDRIMHFAWATDFLIPVDVDLFTDYQTRIAYPCDLSTIRARLSNGFYRRPGAIVFDVEHIYANAVAFNGPHHDIVQYAKLLRNVLVTFIEDSSGHDIEVICEMEVGKLPHALRALFVSSAAHGVDLGSGENVRDAKRKRTDETSLSEVLETNKGCGSPCAVGVNLAAATTLGEDVFRDEAKAATPIMLKTVEVTARNEDASDDDEPTIIAEVFGGLKTSNVTTAVPKAPGYGSIFMEGASTSVFGRPPLRNERTSFDANEATSSATYRGDASAKSGNPQQTNHKSVKGFAYGRYNKQNGIFEEA